MNKAIFLVVALSSINCHFGLLKQFSFDGNNKFSLLKTFSHGNAHIIGFMNQIEDIKLKLNRNRRSSPIVSDILAISDVSIESPTSKYDKCLDKLEVILKNFVEMARLCLDHKWQDTIPIFNKTLLLIYEDVNCFIYADKESKNLGIDPKCVIDHLKKAAEYVKHIIDDIKAHDWKAVQKHVQELVAVIQDIKNC